MSNLSWDELIAVLKYDSDTGIFTWNKDIGKRIKKGSIAGCINSQGYVQITIAKKAYLAHRLAWFYSFKEWPEEQIDHINRNRHDNRLDNLRDVTQSINIHNADTSSKLAVSGYKNVRKRAENRYQAIVEVYGKYVSIGFFSSGDAASIAAKEFKEKYINESIS